MAEPIRVRLSAPMLSVLDPSTFELAIDGEAVTGARKGVDAFAGALEQRAEVSLQPKDGQTRQLARHAAKRCREAIARAIARDALPVPVSIPHADRDGLGAIAAGRVAIVPQRVLEQLADRELIEADIDRWQLTDRGRAVVDGTPPGDLVPFGYFRNGVRVRMIHDTIIDAPNLSGLAKAGEVFAVVETTRDRRLVLVPKAGGFIAFEAAHPRIVHVLGFGRSQEEKA